MKRHKPAGQRNLAAFHNGPHGHGELAATVVALDGAGTMGLAVESGAVSRLAMRADRTVRPNQVFEVLPGLFVGQLSKLHQSHFPLPVVVYYSVDRVDAVVNEYVDSYFEISRKTLAA